VCAERAAAERLRPGVVIGGDGADRLHHDGLHVPWGVSDDDGDDDDARGGGDDGDECCDWW
jgi:hypothetical protein